MLAEEYTSAAAADDDDFGLDLRTDHFQISTSQLTEAGPTEITHSAAVKVVVAVVDTLVKVGVNDGAESPIRSKCVPFSEASGQPQKRQLAPP